MAVEVRSWTAAEARARIEELIALLEDSVAGGASVGFLPPLERLEAREYWRGALAEIAAGHRLLLAALDEGALAGSVQLALESRPNGNHRAEVMKLMVLAGARRRGIGRALMRAAEHEARRAGRSLLVLDTRRGDDAGRLYRNLGWIEAGVIPRYARGASGTLDDTVFFYREI
ncbi:MAG: GNAT family N-acetyltransferase [Bryobacteraceae bacterium]